MRSHFYKMLFVLILIAGSLNAQNVTVNPGAGSYPTMKDAFDAINAGTHTGAITIDVVGNTVETVTAVLNASGSGSANYTSVVIKPVGAARTIQGNIAGAVIRLAGADNVTIDGRIGLANFRNLAIQNTGNSASSAAIWLSHGAGAATDSAGAQNNLIRNCTITTGVSVGSSSNVSFCVVLSGTTISTSSQGRNNNNNTILNNIMFRARYGVSICGGGGTSLNQNNRIDSNIIGSSAYDGGAIGKTGILVQFQNNCNIEYNTVKYIGGPSTNTTAGADRVGIGVGSETWSIGTSSTTAGTNHKVNGNIIRNIREGRTFSAVGIICATSAGGPPTGNVITNNVIYDVLANSTAPDVPVGIAHAGNRGDLIAYNSIYMVGDLDPAGEFIGITSRPAIGIEVGVTGGDTALTIKNNSIYVDCTADTMTLPTSYAIVMPNAYGWGSGGSNNNDYYVGSNPLGRVGALRTGTTYPFAQFATLANWQTAFTPPQDANSISADPLYSLPTTTYLLMPQAASPLKLAGTPIAGVTMDILNEVRSPFTPAIGAYEYDSIALPVELSSLTSQVSGRDVTLNWTTSSELNNSGFDIERSALSNEWIKVGSVAGNGTTTSPVNYSFTDRNLATGRYSYRLKQIDFNGNYEYFNLVNEISIGVPASFRLSQNYPNPFNPSTTINYDLPYDSRVNITLFDISGRQVANVVSDYKPAGYHTVTFNASALSSGTYFYRIDASGSGSSFTDTKKMMLVK
ncbi:MAG: T9SS type A sorting domain-containing protein [Ignavibacteria bacterium]|nr:T9SS type A sorting domain-containing protein [Ignavibacteria bacterium]